MRPQAQIKCKSAFPGGGTSGKAPALSPSRRGAFFITFANLKVTDMDANGAVTNLPDPYFDPLKTPVTLEVDTGSGKLRYTLNVTGVTKEDYNKGAETSEGLILGLADLKAIMTGTLRSPNKTDSASTMSAVCGSSKSLCRMASTPLSLLAGA